MTVSEREVETSRSRREIEEAAQAVRARSRTRPEVGIILGTGLGDFAESLAVESVVPYRDIPHFPVSTVESHAGELHLGTLSGRPVAVMKGRVHYYEGYTMRQVAFPVRVLKALGCETLVITNACGGMNPDMPPGTIVAITDHINLMGDNPLIGINDDRLGPRFPDMCEPYDQELIDVSLALARREDFIAHQGVLVAVMGPNLETRAEYRFLRQIGADAVGMSTVPEVLVARHCGLAVVGFSVITDMCLPDALEPANIERIIATANAAEPQLLKLVTGVLAHVAAGRWRRRVE
jgi:purine-nucleoside phosphorylase